MPSKLVTACAEMLIDKKLSMSTAESASAGRVAAEFSLVPKCGKMLKGGIVCYDACIKQDILGVAAQLVEEFTPESAEVTQAIAEGLGRVMPADIQVGVTGLTMPGGSETEEKPVGTMFIHAIIKGKPYALREVYRGSSEEIVLQTVDRVAALLLQELN